MAVNRWQWPIPSLEPQVELDEIGTPSEEGQTEIGLSIGIALDPVLAGNEITLNAENCSNSRIAGVVFEKHFHFGQTPSTDGSEQDFSRSSSSGGSSGSSRLAFASLAASYIRQYSWICPPSGNPRYDVEDLYVGLKMKLMDRDGHVRHGDARKKKILFEPFNRTRVKPRAVLVVGGPGFGKTTLCRKMAYDWAGQGKTFPEFSSDEAVVLYLDVSRLNKDAILEKELVKLAAQEDGLTHDGITETGEMLKSYDRNVIVVLDGFVGSSENIQAQIKELIKSRPNSVFKRASVVVTSRPGLDEETLQLFHKHFCLEGFSVGLAEKLVFKYFKRSSSPLGAYYKDVLRRLQMKKLSPLVILSICECEINFKLGFEMNDLFRQLALRIGKLCNTRNHLGLTEDQVESKLDRLGWYLWKCLCRKKEAFTRADLELNLKEDSKFALSSGLLITKDDSTTWQPINTVLADSIAMYHLERYWQLSCKNITSFLMSLFPKMPSLEVSCYVNRLYNEASFRVLFYYMQFGMCFLLRGNECKFTIFSKFSDLPSFKEFNALNISYLFFLDKKEDCKLITDSLRIISSNQESWCCLSEFISPLKFAQVHLNFEFSCNSAVQTFLSKELQQSHDPVDSAATCSLHPLALLRMPCRELTITFSNSTCRTLFIRPILMRVLEITEDRLKCDSEYQIVESLRAASYKPAFVSAHIQGSKTMYYSHLRCVRVRDGSQLNALCDRLELIFRNDDDEVPLL